MYINIYIYINYVCMYTYIYIHIHRVSLFPTIISSSPAKKKKTRPRTGIDATTALPWTQWHLQHQATWSGDERIRVCTNNAVYVKKYIYIYVQGER